MATANVLVAGSWRASRGTDQFLDIDPATGSELGRFPVSGWEEVDEALAAAYDAFPVLRDTAPEQIASFLRAYADLIEERREIIVEAAHSETALPQVPRLAEVELPRTTDQLRQAADAAESRTWVEATLSPAAGIASWMAPIPGVVCVFGPNNFPLAFNGISGGDFAAAIATRHPILAKANPGHPETTRLLAVAAFDAVNEVGLPSATVQLLYRTTHEHGARMVSDPRVAATGYTGSRGAGLALKQAADRAGIPIYLEMSSVNPVVVLPGAAAERPEELADDLATSLFLGCGQFCTNPGLTFVSGDAGEPFLNALASRVSGTPSGTLLDLDMPMSLEKVHSTWEKAGASVLGAAEGVGEGASYPNTVLIVDGKRFLRDPQTFQEEAFGNLGLVVHTAGDAELIDCLRRLEANLTGTIYSASDGSDDRLYSEISPVLRDKVGRLLNDKMPTGVAVVSAMNHGGPYPATGHPGFTAVGIPASLRRFAMLQCYDNVADQRLPAELQAGNPLGIQRFVEGSWTSAEIAWMT